MADTTGVTFKNVVMDSCVGKLQGCSLYAIIISNVCTYYNICFLKYRNTSREKDAHFTRWYYFPFLGWANNLTHQ